MIATIMAAKVSRRIGGFMHGSSREKNYGSELDRAIGLKYCD